MAEKFNDVWDALIDDPAAREACKIKSSLMAAIAVHLKERGLTQKEGGENHGSQSTQGERRRAGKGR